MARFLFTSEFSEPPATLFAWHVRPGALTRLTPPWQALRRLDPDAPVTEGQEVHLQLRLGPWSLPWTALHRDVVPDEQFVDQMVQGPFADWVHRHRFLPAAQGSQVRDEIAWRLPGGRLVEGVAEPVVRRLLVRAFRYRHRVLRADLLRHRAWNHRPRLRVAVTGATGLIGRQLCAFLSTGGHQVRIVTRHPRPGSSDIGWNPREGRLEPSALEGLDAVVHLAGQGIAGRWTPGHKAEVLRSRVEGTRLLARTLAGLQHPPGVLVTSSAIGFYGNRGSTPVSEESPAGRGFLAEVCQAWEAACAPASEAGIRVVNVRTGLVLTPAGGALAAMLPAFRLGLGGPTGSGRQSWSWITMDDLLAVYHEALLDEGLVGPVNGVADSCSSAGFAATLGRVLGRPAVLPLPAAAVRLLLGEMGEELLLAGARVLPEALGRRGFRFAWSDLDSALGHVLGRTGSGS